MSRALAFALLCLGVGCDGGVTMRDADGGGGLDAGGIPAPTWRSDAGADAAPMADGAVAVDAALADAGPPLDDAGIDCVSGSAPWAEYTVSDADRSRSVPLPLELDVPYRTLTVELEVEPGQWQPDCWNPAGGRTMSPFQILLEVRKGAAWCRGGNLLELAARGGGNDDLWMESYYAERVGSSCSGEQHEIVPMHPRSPLELGVTTPVRAHLDAVARTVEIAVGDVVRTGPMDPRVEIVGRAGEVLHLVTSIDRSLECYAPGGGAADECCHLPSFAWTYRNLRYTACR